MEISENSRQQLVATNLTQMGWQMSKAVGRKLRTIALVLSPAPVRQVSRTLLEIHMEGSSQRLGPRLIPARQPVKERFVEKSIATLRSRHKRGQTREDAENLPFRRQAGSGGGLFAGKQSTRGGSQFRDVR